MSSRVVLFSALLAPFVAAFSPEFSTPFQCGELTISWSSSPLEGWTLPEPISSPEIALSLIPVDNGAASSPVEPFTISVPCSHEDLTRQLFIPTLPFPVGTQFFASAYVPGFPGLGRRTVSKVFSVEASSDSSCLPKSFEKRQISVIGTGVVDATATFPSVASAPTEAIRVIGPSTIPVADADVNTAAPAPVNNVAPNLDNASGTPAIIEVGTSFITDGAVDPTATEDTNFVASSTDDSSSPTETYTDNQEDQFNSDKTSYEGYTDDSEEYDSNLEEEYASTSTDCTESAQQTADATSVDEYTTTYTAEYESETDSYQDENSEEDQNSYEDEYPYYDDEDNSSSNNNTYYDDSEASRSHSEVVTYESYDDMVNAANYYFKAWNPYRTYGYPPPISTASRY